MDQSISLGADPEIFVVNKKDEIVSASTIIEKEQKNVEGTGGVANDGMQIELHPLPSQCRETLISNLYDCIKEADLLAHAKGFKLTDSFTKDVSQEILSSLAPEVQALGCEPDYSAYGGKIKILNIDGSKHFKRYCGGHIHLGIFQVGVETEVNYKTRVKESYHDNADYMTKMFDYLVGNTLVLLDHDESNVERRKVYGQAGSYRRQTHGIEYRTLSNFWLRHTSLVSLTFLLARIAARYTPPIVDDALEVDPLKTLTNLVNEKDIENAINNNDYVLAEKNFKKIFSFLITRKRQSYFEYLLEEDIRYILYLNKFPERAIYHDKSITDNWKTNVEGRSWHDGHENYGWGYFKAKNLKKIHTDASLVRDFTNININ